MNASLRPDRSAPRLSALGRFTAAGLTLSLLLFTTSCEEPMEPVDSHVNPVLSGRPASQSSLQQGLSFLRQLDESNGREAQRRTQQQLQDWLSQQKADPQWKPDPMRDQLPRPFDQLAPADQLKKLAFDTYDVISLRESQWLSDIAQTNVRQGKLDPHLQALVQRTAEGGATELANDLANAVRLFDWTVLNLQLDGDFDPNAATRFQSNLVLQTWESLLMGRGTMEEKSRIFSQLSRQIGLPVVMLAIQPSDSEFPRPWAAGLLTQDQLYLFDMRLGAPLVDPQSQKILTWSQLRDHPEILEALQTERGSGESLKADDLSHVVAWIDATPSDLSQRMQLLEAALLGDNKMSLTASPTAIAEKLHKAGSVKSIGLWPLPYLSYAQRSSLDPKSPAVAELSLEHSLFDRQPLLRLARVQHFRGQYESTEEARGARPLYLLSRIPEEEIARILDVPMQVAEGTSPSAEEQQMHQQRQEYAHSLARRSKQNASYWLGLIALDEGEYQVAADYFEKRLLAIDPDSVWAPGAYYALGRTYEAWGRAESSSGYLSKALEIYQSAPDSVYAAAHQWRAAQLARELEGPPPVDNGTTDADENTSQPSSATDAASAPPANDATPAESAPESPAEDPAATTSEPAESTPAASEASETSEAEGTESPSGESPADSASEPASDSSAP